jgi:uncharacterized protein YcfJ
VIRYVVSAALTFVIATVIVFAVGCESEAQNDALIGGAIGTGAGAIIGHQSGHAGTGALIGGAVGGGTGYVIGNEKEKKQQQGTPTVQPTQQAAGAVTVNITNSNGSITPVKLTRQGNDYVGPRGEVYDHFPTEAELKPVYGF